MNNISYKYQKGVIRKQKPTCCCCMPASFEGSSSESDDSSPEVSSFSLPAGNAVTRKYNRFEPIQNKYVGRNNWFKIQWFNHIISTKVQLHEFMLSVLFPSSVKSMYDNVCVCVHVCIEYSHCGCLCSFTANLS